MKTVLITGAMGFIGSHLAKNYLEQGHKVVGVDNLSTSVRKPSEKEFSENPNFQFYKMDLAAPSFELLESLVSQSDLIYHMAGSVGVEKIDADPKASIINNHLINTHLFPLLAKHGKQTVFASTSEVYGETERAREEHSLSIGSPETLRWGYASGKLYSEFLLRSMNIPHATARLFNITGAGQTGKHGMVLPKFVEQAKQGLPISVYDEGAQTRSFCDIRDAVGMLVFLGEDPRAQGEVFNIGSEENVCSIKKLALMVKQMSGSNSEIVYTPFKKNFSRMSADIKTRTPSMAKMNSYLRARRSLKEIITSMLEAQ